MFGGEAEILGLDMVSWRRYRHSGYTEYLLRPSDRLLGPTIRERVEGNPSETCQFAVA